MTYHDRRLSLSRILGRCRRESRISGMLRGVDEITIFPSIPAIELGSQADDWRAVGADIREAMRKFEKNG